MGRIDEMDYEQTRGTMKRGYHFLALGFLLLSACATPQTLTYDIGLDAVERPSDATERYGEFEIFQDESEDARYVFEDEMIRAFWIAHPATILFEIENKTENSIRILWDEAAFVDPDGGSHRVMHQGVRYADRNSPQAPTVIARGARISDVIHPTDYITYSGGTYGQGWVEEPIIEPYRVGLQDTNYREQAEANVGKTFSVLMPLEIEGVTNEYTFTFRIRDVDLPEE